MPAGRGVDVALSPLWETFVGQTVTGVAAAWQPGGPGDLTLWSLRLDFGARSCVTALGTDDRGLQYVPDELIVTADPARAREYCPSDTSGSAWGENVRPA